jgi:small-conductance mechanosensitive channel
MQIPKLRAARPYLIRAAILGALALTALVIAQHFGDEVLGNGAEPTPSERTFFFASAIVLLVAGLFAVRSATNAIRSSLEEVPGDGRGAAPAFLASVVGYTIVVLSTVSVLGVNLSGLLLGGAVTGVVIGIAAQQTLGNFFAGIVLIAVRPFVVGEEVVLRSAPLGGEYEGRITDMSLFYVKMDTAQGPVALPNAGVLAAAVGPGAKAPKHDDNNEDEGEELDPGPAHGGTPT